MRAEPLIWVLCGARAGDTAQARELARRVGGRIVEKQLAFNPLHLVPNVLRPPGLYSLTSQARASIAAPWPDLVIATGKRTAPIARAIKALSNNHSKLVQLGRPRAALHHFDLVITTPQYGLPDAENVVTLPTPFAAPLPVDEAVQSQWSAAWQHLPRPWIMAAVGASKYPLKLGGAELVEFANALNAASKKLNASLLLFDSPRSSPDALAHVAAQLKQPHWSATRRQSEGAYQSALALADHLAVTGDSVSMASEMLATGKPVAVSVLPRNWHLDWSARQGLGATLARSGLLSPPRDVHGFMTTLTANGSLGILGQSWGKADSDSNAHEAVVQRIRTLTDLT